MQNVNSVQGFIREAVECSVYLSPRDIGLTLAEVQEAAKQAGYRPGETQDALGPAAPRPRERRSPRSRSVRQGLRSGDTRGGRPVRRLGNADAMLEGACPIYPQVTGERTQA